MPNASAMPDPMRAIASSSLDPFDDPTCSTTPASPSRSPISRCCTRLSMEARWMLRVVVAGLPGGPARHLAVGRAEVDEVEAVAHDRPDPGLARLLAEGGDLLVAVVDRPPGARVVREDLEALALQVAPPSDRLRDASGRRDVGAESHAHYPTGRGTRQTRGDRTGARALRPEPDRQPPCGRGPHGPLQLAHRPAHRGHLRAAARGHRPGALDARERGGDPALPHLARARLGRGPAAPERARRRLRRRHRAAEGRRRDLPGLRDRGGGRRPARRGPGRQARPRGAGQPRPHPRGDRRVRGRGPPPGLALRRGAPGRDGDRGLRPRAGDVRPRRRSRTSSSPAPTARRPTTSPPRSTTWRWTSPTSSAARTTSPTRPSR